MKVRMVIQILIKEEKICLNNYFYIFEYKYVSEFR